MSSKKSPKPATPKSGEKNWKGSLIRLISCGSGKNKDEELKANAPIDRATLASPANNNDDYTEVNHDIITTKATPGHGDEEEVEISYTEVKVIGKGTFGVVYRARLCSTGDLVAIKKVLHDERYKNRELQMMKKLNHPNILPLRYFFYSQGDKYRSNELYLNMLLDYVPETLYSVAQCDGTRRVPLLDILYVKVYLYQVFRSLAYLHTFDICHRDIKPQNLLLDPNTHVIKLCDFGSAKEINSGEANISYICSRYYRAPELVLGTTNYTQQIDVWSAGCVLAELLLGQPIFPGANGPDQLVEIIKTLGTPSVDDVFEINPNYVEFRFPQLFPIPWPKVFRETKDMDVLDLVAQLLVYSPSKRLHPIQACAHNCFDVLRDPRTRLPDGKPLPHILFEYTNEELSISPGLTSRLMPLEISPDFDYLVTDTPHTGQESTGKNLLGQIGGSFRSSFKGIKKTPAFAKSSSKKKNKSGGKDDHGIEEPVPRTLDFSDDQEDMERVERVGENAAGRDSPQPDADEVMLSAHTAPRVGERHDSIPPHYQDFLNEPEVEPHRNELEIHAKPSSGKKKKKKKTRTPEGDVTPEALERSVEEEPISARQQYDDDELDRSVELQTRQPPKLAPKPKKAKKPVASTPTGRSFEEENVGYPPASRHQLVESFDDEPPLAAEITSAPSGDETHVRVQKKKKKKATSNNGSLNDSARQSVNTEI